MNKNTPILYSNPYLGLELGKTAERITADVAFLDYHLIRQFGRGSISTTVNLIINELTKKCRELGYTNFTNGPEFEQLVIDTCKYVRGYQPGGKSITGVASSTGTSVQSSSGGTPFIAHQETPITNDERGVNGIPSRPKTSKRIKSHVKK